MDKKTTIRSKKTANIRGWIQAAATLLTNIHIPNFFKGKIYQGNACDLSFIESDTYDIVLLLGPMYHLFNDEDKNRAISEAIRVAKKGGIIYSAYCNSDTCVYKYFYKKKILHYID